MGNMNLETLSSLLLALGFFSPVVAIICAVIFYARHCRAYPNKEGRIPVIAYILALLVCAGIAFFIGLQFGISWACSSPWGGNLCGLFGVFVSGPVAAALAIFVVGASTMLLPGDESTVQANRRRTISSIFLKLWHGQYSLGRSFWGFFILGACIFWLVGILAGFLFLFYPPTLWIFRLVFLGYLVTAAVGVWRSANVVANDERHPKTYADSVKVIAAKIAVVLIGLLMAVGGKIELAIRSFLYAH